MRRKVAHLIFIIMVFIITGCIKDTYDMDKLSGKVHLSPSILFPAINGGISFSDLVDSNDTIVFDQDNFVKIVFKEDSLFDFEIIDFYDLNDMISFNESYTIGEMSIDPFYKMISFSLDEISMLLSPVLRAGFVALDNTTNNFPGFPSTDLGENTFTSISNFEHAVFSSGNIDISVVNNLTAPLSGITIQLYKEAGHTPIGNQANISLIQPGNTGIASIDLTNQALTNTITTEVIINGSPGTSTPVLIDLDGSNVELSIRGRDLRVKSGRVILPLQMVESLEEKDTMTFESGTDIEIDVIKIETGVLSYNIQSPSLIQAAFELTLPSAIRSGVALTELIRVDPNIALNGSIEVSNTIIDLGTDPLHPFNRAPMEYSIEVSSDNIIVDFDSEDAITLDFKLLNPDIDYVKGYFGQQVEEIEPESIDLEIEDILSNLSGDFLLSSPSIKLSYSNSFAIPIELYLDAIGTRNDETVKLGLDTFAVDFPNDLITREVDDIFVIDKTNSYLPELVSMPPGEISFSGSAKINPLGNTGLRDNYIFGDSRFIGSLEVEVPLEFRMNNLQFSDTLENFMTDTFEEDSDLSWDDFELFTIDLNVENGFPMGVSVTMSLYDSISHEIISSIDGTDILEPAEVDGNGKATGVTTSTTSIDLTEEFFSSIEDAESIIFVFTLNTTNNGSEDVKIYSDYRIDFKAAMILKPNINVNIK
jgi:hypothetical protein